ncbi:TRAP transporter permease [Arenibacterium halophilum]|uniref:TRAP transporter fused permease subunit n=1 Tax=Arenibacterium halophilum TaxID=2583821 RepID=A0ABY2WYP4_9RHOB|nr:TRAP transporter fused permease subunit [Arenibacterium halophilum]TMV07447.1 TRAP transporter fused permease subunit [Arenibacterium halophilum]
MTPDSNTDSAASPLGQTGARLGDRLGLMGAIVALVAIGFSLFQLWSNGLALMPSFKQNAWHVAFALVLGFLVSPIGKGWWRVIDLACAAASLGAIIFIVLRYDVMAARFGIFLGPEVIAASVIVVMVLELARRLLGLTLALLCGAFILYGFYGYMLPGAFGHQGFPVQRIASYLVMTTDGVFGTAVGVSATLISVFVIFGAFLTVTGCGQWFIDIANLIAGRTVGGSAKVAVLASSLMGSVSGSAAGNVATTGAFTIPLMKKAGFTPVQAGAIEAVASTGGTILPPLMGAGAFVMAELLGIQYSSVALAAIMPAILYYLAVFCQVDIMARRDGRVGFVADRREMARQIVLSGWRSIPLLVLIWMILVERYSPAYAAFWSIGAAVVLGLVMSRGRARLLLVPEALRTAAQAMLPIAIACAAAGIIVGVLMLTGLGLRLSSLMIDLAGGNLALLLVLTMISSIILGMGVPATAAYIILAVLAVPALVKLGVAPLSAHMFVFYFGTISNITPPVAVAAFVAAGLSGGTPARVAVEAFRIGSAAFLIPFMFVYGPELLLVDANALSVIRVLVTASLGIIALVVAIQGWLFVRLGPGLRVIAAAISILLVVQSLWSDVLGLAAIAVFFTICRLRLLRSPAGSTAT